MRKHGCPDRKFAPRTLKLDQDVLYRFYELGPRLDERMRTARCSLTNGTGHCEHLAALFKGTRGRNQGATPLSCLNNDDTDRETRDDPVALREGPRPRVLSVWKLRNHNSPFCDFLTESGILGRVNAVKS